MSNIENKKNLEANNKEQNYLSYPFNDNIPQGYELLKCYHCSQKYLSQNDLVEELMFCPIHKNFDFCSSCKKTFDATTQDLQFNQYGELKCKKCFKDICLECGVEIEDYEKDNRFCSQSCSANYWGELYRDE